jgi:hypothetical protein
MRCILLLLLAITPMLQSQIQYPFSGVGKDNDIAAYWYNVPKDSLVLKVMGQAVPFQSTLEVYAESPADSFTVSLVARGRNGTSIFSGTYLLKKTGAEPPVRVQRKGRFFKIIIPVPYRAEPPTTIEVTIGAGSIHRTKNVECRYHKLSGSISDFEGRPFRAAVLVRPDDFDGSAGVWSDADGKYSILLPERIYSNMFVDDESYGMQTAEAWGWHLIMDGDQSLDIKVGTGEVYNLNVWPNNGGSRTYFISFRPMSVFFYHNRTPSTSVVIEGKSHELLDVAARLTSKEITVKFNGEVVPIVSTQLYYEWTSGRVMPAYLLQVSREGLENIGKQTVVVEYHSESDVKGQKVVHTSMGVFQLYPNFTGLSFYWNRHRSHFVLSFWSHARCDSLRMVFIGQLVQTTR